MILGIIGGSGIYEIDDLEDPQWISVNSSFGSPSDDVLVGHIKGIKMVFLPRHGRGHVIPPSDVNYRANIDVLVLRDELSINSNLLLVCKEYHLSMQYINYFQLIRL